MMDSRNDYPSILVLFKQKKTHLYNTLLKEDSLN